MKADKAHRKRASKERGSKKSLRDSISLGIKKRFVGGQVTDALAGISRIEPKIHRMKLSGDYSYRDLKKLGPLKVDHDFDPINRPKYQKRAYRQLKDGVLTIYHDRTEKLYPKCFIEFSYPAMEFLIGLDRLLPELKLSSLELAVDIFCRNHEYVEALFWALKRALLVPFQRSAMQYDGTPSVEIGKGVGMNSTMIIGDVEVYERGADGDKKDGGWTEEECNRVRMEFRAERRLLEKIEIIVPPMGKYFRRLLALFELV